MEPSSLAGEQKKLLLWLTLACLSINILIEKVEQEVSLQNDRKWAWVNGEWAWSQNFCVHFARNTIAKPSFTIA